jgi:hypothetical protein
MTSTLDPGDERNTTIENQISSLVKTKTSLYKNVQNDKY